MCASEPDFWFIQPVNLRTSPNIIKLPFLTDGKEALYDIKVLYRSQCIVVIPLSDVRKLPEGKKKVRRYKIPPP